MNERDQYLRRVRFWLPKRCGRDLMQRISADLEEHLDSGAERGGGATKKALREFGHPAVVATRYSEELPLVSGGLMTVYKKVLWIAFTAILLIQVALIAGELGFTDQSAGPVLRDSAASLSFGLLLAFAAVTLVFAGLTRAFYLKSGHGCGPR